MLKIDFLNHSSLLIKNGRSSLLLDPWLKGSAFSGGWDLEWSNDRAVDDASEADYLWFSHPHSDHLHFESLKELIHKKPDMELLGFENSKISICNILEKSGLTKRRRIHDRVPVLLDPETRVLNIPSLAIDNVLGYQHKEYFLLNVNDAIIGAKETLQVLKKSRFLPVNGLDAILINFSHANKITKAEIQELKEHYAARIKSFIDVFKPRYVFPIASFHLYTGDLAKWQNRCRMEIEDVGALDSRIRPIFPGDKIELTKTDMHVVPGPRIKNALQTRSYPKTIDVQTFKIAFKKFSKKMKSEFLLRWLLPADISVRFSDWGNTLRLSFQKGTMEPVSTPSFDLQCHSSWFHLMITKVFGFDSFYVAADYSTSDQPGSIRRVKDLIFKGCLIDYSLSPRQMIKSFFNGTLWKFSWNRREQIWQLLTAGYKMGGIGKKQVRIENRVNIPELSEEIDARPLDL